MSEETSQQHAGDEAIYLYYDDTQHGPLSSAQVRGLYQNGAIGTDTPACRAGMAEWQPLMVVLPELAQVASTQSSPVKPVKAQSQPAGAPTQPIVSQKTLVALAAISLFAISIFVFQLETSEKPQAVPAKPPPSPQAPKPVSTPPQQAEDGSRKRLLDEAQQLLDEREDNNKRIERLLKSRRELNGATLDLIQAIKDSKLPDKSQRLNDPKIQKAIDDVSKMEDEITKVSLKNKMLKLKWDVRKSDFPESLRFSSPKFYNASILTDWKMEEW